MLCFNTRALYSFALIRGGNGLGRKKKEAIMMMFTVHEILTMKGRLEHIHEEKRIFNMFEIPICAII